MAIDRILAQAGTDSEYTVAAGIMTFSFVRGFTP